ncbi:MAG: hypothetical protein K9I36_16685, partial [Bacteroidia bacterium]|nr:hypothetical protein [Bacteroidia bacterium]
MEIIKNITKQEALQKLDEGETLTHRNFDSSEFMKKDGIEYLFEDGVRCPIAEFWKWRITPMWYDGWEIKLNPEWPPQ